MSDALAKTVLIALAVLAAGLSLWAIVHFNERQYQKALTARILLSALMLIPILGPLFYFLSLSRPPGRERYDSSGENVAFYGHESSGSYPQHSHSDHHHGGDGSQGGDGGCGDSGGGDGGGGGD